MHQIGRILVSLGLIAVLLVSGGGIGYFLYHLREAPPKRERAALPPVVQSVVIHAEDVVEHFVGYGVGLADRTATLGAEVSGTVIERIGDIEAGAEVSEGQPLIRLDDRQYELDLARAQALVAADQARIDEIEVERLSLEKLKATAEKEVRIAAEEQATVTDLFETGQAHKREFNLSRLAYQQARRLLQNHEMQLAVLEPGMERAFASKRANEAAVGIAKLNIERCTLRAPFTGHIDLIMVDTGDQVGPGTSVLTMVDTSRVEVPVQLPSSVRSLVEVGAQCALESQSTPGVEWLGSVARIAPVSVERTRTFAAYVEIDNSRQDHVLAGGTFVRAVVDGPLRKGALLIPRGAIRRGQVMVVEDGVVHLGRVTIERFLFDHALVKGDIHDGSRVILSHLDSLTEGSEVRVGIGEAGGAGTTVPSSSEKPGHPNDSDGGTGP